MQSYGQRRLEECELAEEMGFDWISCSEHHYSGNGLTPTRRSWRRRIATVQKVRIALLGQLTATSRSRRYEEIGMLDNLTGGRVIMAFLRASPARTCPTV